MDILLDPNVAYMILLGGVLLSFLAIVTPGTGLFEVGTVFCIVLTGYAFYHLSVNGWAILVMLLSIVPFVYASRNPDHELYLGLAILLMAIGSMFIFPQTSLQPAVNPLLAGVASILLGGFFWIAVRKSLVALQIRPLNSLDRLIGQTGQAKTKIQEEGCIQVSGELWSARSDFLIPFGSHIKVIRREGFILVVENVAQSSS